MKNEQSLLGTASQSTPAAFDLHGAVTSVFVSHKRGRTSGDKSLGLIHGLSLHRESQGYGRASEQAGRDSPRPKLVVAVVHRSPAGNQDQLSLPLTDKQVSE